MNNCLGIFIAASISDFIVFNRLTSKSYTLLTEFLTSLFLRLVAFLSSTKKFLGALISLFAISPIL